MELTRPQTWLAAILTLSVYSYLYKENPLYRFAEHTFLGLAVAHAVVLTWHNSLVAYTRTWVMEKGLWWFGLFLITGTLMYFRYIPGRLQWLARYPISIYMGWNLGYSLVRTPRPYAVQMVDTMRSLGNLENLLFFVMFVLAMMYFFLTVGRNSKGVITAGRLGRYVMMVAFGASFGNTIQGRITLFLGRLSFLLKDWLGMAM